MIATFSKQEFTSQNEFTQRSIWLHERLSAFHITTHVGLQVCVDVSYHHGCCLTAFFRRHLRHHLAHRSHCVAGPVRPEQQLQAFNDMSAFVQCKVQQFVKPWSRLRRHIGDMSFDRSADRICFIDCAKIRPGIGQLTSMQKSLADLTRGRSIGIPKRCCVFFRDIPH